MTTIPKPTSPTEVVVGKRNGETVVAALMYNDEKPWALRHPGGGFRWRSWSEVCDELTDIRVEDVPELAAEIDQLKARIADLEAAKPEPGPWLTGDELKAVMPTLKTGDVVEVEWQGHAASGELWAHSSEGLSLWDSVVRFRDGEASTSVHALRVIKRAPEPGADIPDEVVEAAWDAFDEYHESTRESFRAALAAADAKRAELEGQA